MISKIFKNKSVEKNSEKNVEIDLCMKYSTGKFSSLNFSLIFGNFDSSKA